MALSNEILALIEARPKERRPVLDVPFTPRVADIDEPSEPDVELDDPLASAYAEGQTFAICYSSAEGSESLRRITVWSIKKNSAGNAVLFAKCAERNAMRSFRIDRIRYCIDMNGEVFEPPERFLAETFGLPENFTAAGSSEPTTRQVAKKNTSYRALRDSVQHELVALSAMSECDGFVAFPETVAIIDFVRCRSSVLRLELTAEDEKKLVGYVRRLRPNAEQLRTALNAIERLPIQMQIDFLAACQEVMFADGEVHQAEQLLLDSIRTDLVGL